LRVLVLSLAAAQNVRAQTPGKPNWDVVSAKLNQVAEGVAGACRRRRLPDG
jgi:hypothetical protein